MIQAYHQGLEKLAKPDEQLGNFGKYSEGLSSVREDVAGSRADFERALAAYFRQSPMVAVNIREVFKFIDTFAMCDNNHSRELTAKEKTALFVVGAQLLNASIATQRENERNNPQFKTQVTLQDAFSIASQAFKDSYDYLNPGSKRSVSTIEGCFGGGERRRFRK